MAARPLVRIGGVLWRLVLFTAVVAGVTLMAGTVFKLGSLSSSMRGITLWSLPAGLVLAIIAEYLQRPVRKGVDQPSRSTSRTEHSESRHTSVPRVTTPRTATTGAPKATTAAPKAGTTRGDRSARTSAESSPSAAAHRERGASPETADPAAPPARPREVWTPPGARKHSWVQRR